MEPHVYISPDSNPEKLQVTATSAEQPVYAPNVGAPIALDATFVFSWTERNNAELRSGRLDPTLVERVVRVPRRQVLHIVRRYIEAPENERDDFTMKGT